MKSTLLIKKEIAEAIMSANEFQRAYQAFSGVNIKTREDKMDLDPEVAKAAQPWIDKVLCEAFGYLLKKAQAEIPGMKEAPAQRNLEYSLAFLIKAWADRRAMIVQYSKLFDNMPFIGAGLNDKFGEAVVHEFKLNYPIQQLAGAYAVDPPKPLTCSVCGKTQCEHLQTIMDSVVVAGDTGREIIDALFEDTDKHGGRGGPDGA